MQAAFHPSFGTNLPRSSRELTVIGPSYGVREARRRLNVMRRLSLIAAAMIAAIFLAGCAGGDGVDKHLGAFHKGCTPVPGGVSCTGG